MSKTYRVEIESLFVQDVEANSKKEALEKVDKSQSIDFSNGLGTFFYEEHDFNNNLKITEE